MELSWHTAILFWFGCTVRAQRPVHTHLSVPCHTGPSICNAVSACHGLAQLPLCNTPESTQTDWKAHTNTRRWPHAHTRARMHTRTHVRKCKKTYTSRCTNAQDWTEQLLHLYSTGGIILVKPISSASSSFPNPLSSTALRFSFLAFPSLALLTSLATLSVSHWSE